MFEKIKLELEPNLILPGGEKLSRKSKLCDQVNVRTEIAWQGDQYNVIGKPVHKNIEFRNKDKETAMLLILSL